MLVIDEIINNIHKELRANMNGIASAYMRKNGIQYRLNWGIDLPKLKQIASGFKPNHQLAQRLWNEDVRESRILATLLMPTEKFSLQLCQLWAEQIPNAEIAQMAVINLFSRLSYASDIAFQWMADKQEMKQMMGLLLITRLIMQGQEFNPRAIAEIKNQAECCLKSDNLHLMKAAKNTLTRILSE